MKGTLNMEAAVPRAPAAAEGAPEESVLARPLALTCRPGDAGGCRGDGCCCGDGACCCGDAGAEGPRLPGAERGGVPAPPTLRTEAVLPSAAGGSPAGDDGDGSAAAAVAPALRSTSGLWAVSCSAGSGAASPRLLAGDARSRGVPRPARRKARRGTETGCPSSTAVAGGASRPSGACSAGQAGRLAGGGGGSLHWRPRPHLMPRCLAAKSLRLPSPPLGCLPTRRRPGRARSPGRRGQLPAAPPAPVPWRWQAGITLMRRQPPLRGQSTRSEAGWRSCRPDRTRRRSMWDCERRWDCTAATMKALS